VDLPNWDVVEPPCGARRSTGDTVQESITGGSMDDVHPDIGMFGPDDEPPWAATFADDVADLSVRRRRRRRPAAIVLAAVMALALAAYATDIVVPFIHRAPPSTPHAPVRIHAPLAGYPR